MESYNNVMQNDTQSHTQYFAVSSSKLRNLYLCTFGLYSIYWFYQNWKLQQPFISEKINPALRSVFSIFFTHALARRIAASLKAKGIEENLKLNIWATLFVLLSIFVAIANNISNDSSVPAYWNLLWIGAFFLSVLPLIEIQDSINMLIDDPLGRQNHRLNIWQKIIFVVGGVFWILFILSLVLISLNPELAATN